MGNEEREKRQDWEREKREDREREKRDNRELRNKETISHGHVTQGSHKYIS